MPLNMEQMKLSGFEPDPDLKWEKIGDMAAPPGLDENIYDGALVPIIAAIDERRVLVIDQKYGDITESFVRVFDTRAGEWSNEEWPSLNHTRVGFSCVVCNGKVYVIGGENRDDEYLNSVECLDLSASPHEWTTMEQRLETARYNPKGVAIGAQVFILGGYGEGNNVLASVEILNTETGQLVRGPDIPPNERFTAASVNNELLVFANPIEGDGGDTGEIHTLRQGQQIPTWEMTSFSLPKETIVFKPIVIGDCVVLSQNSDSVYDTKRDCWWDLPPTPFNSRNWTLVGETEIVAFSNAGIYSLKLKYDVQPPTDTILRHTKTVLGSLLFSPKYSDVTLVCPGGAEIPAHRNILGKNSVYFDTYFSGRWAEQHPDGRYETEKSSDVVKPLLSLMYTGEIPLDTNDSTLVGLLEAGYEFQLNDDLLRVCQRKCIDEINETNVKAFLLFSAKPRNATFLFDACFKYVCEHFFEIIGKDPVFAGDVTKVDDGQLWRQISESAQRVMSRSKAPARRV